MPPDKHPGRVRKATGAYAGSLTLFSTCGALLVVITVFAVVMVVVAVVVRRDLLLTTAAGVGTPGMAGLVACTDRVPTYVMVVGSVDRGWESGQCHQVKAVVVDRLQGAGRCPSPPSLTCPVVPNVCHESVGLGQPQLVGCMQVGHLVQACRRAGPPVSVGHPADLWVLDEASGAS